MGKVEFFSILAVVFGVSVYTTYKAHSAILIINRVTKGGL